ncbi:hypothetical protein [Pedobacter nyackensis]|uniref:hypothetical protein n=1 Tax=Pedobacter nyackensis TaxID=475255 RepID=UPI00292E4D75|nr:hypothetical protein [Pedobacter nyackensis]
MKYNIIFIGFFILVSCTRVIEEKKLVEMFNSKDKRQLLTAIDYVSDHHQVHMVKCLLSDALDPRIVHDVRYKGMSIYQIKMGAMQKLTGVKPVKKITYRPDSSVVDFYLEISVKNGWIN